MESKQKLNNIEIELEDVAQGVRDNIKSIFQRGENFEALAEKSENLKSVSSTLKKKATKIRKDSEPFNLLNLLRSIMGDGFTE